MAKAIAIMVGVILGGHGLLGLFVEGEHLLIFNVDIVLDTIYLSCAAVLLFVGFAPVSAGAVRTVMLAIAGLFTLVGVIGLTDHRLGGAAPTGLTLMDFFIFFALAASLLVGALWRRAAEPIENWA